jgi:glucose/arabinose dehydrogenase
MKTITKIALLCLALAPLAACDAAGGTTTPVAATEASTAPTAAPETTLAPVPTTTQGTQPQRVPTKPAQTTPTLSARDRETLFNAILGPRLNFITLAQAKETAVATCETLDSGVPWAIVKTASTTVGDNMDLEQWQVDELSLAQEIGVRAFCPDHAWQLGAEVG